MRTIVILSDTINRRYLRSYGNTDVHTPNIERLARRSHVFENHWTGSAPCMPARRDLLTGRLNFLERNWGPLEAFDHPLPEVLREHAIRSHITTDHYHYAELGGEGYQQCFTTWQLYRGQENDPQEWMKKPYQAPDRIGKIHELYEHNRRNFVSEEAYTSPQTYRSAAEWLTRHGREDNYLLWIEGFDPHEPFDVPEDYLQLYGDDYVGKPYEWPLYAPFDGNPEELKHLRNRYKALLTMTDYWIGRVLDVCDRLNLWEDTMIVFTTDHGYMLGEHGVMAKNYMQGYNELYHIPMMIHQPGQQDEHRIAALSQNIDLFPTICEHFAIPKGDIKNPIHGKSLYPLMDGSADSVHQAVLYGVFGKSVNLSDGRYTYFKAPARDDNTPLNIYTSMPTTFRQYIGTSSLTNLHEISAGPYLPWTNFPVYRIPAANLELEDPSHRFSGRSEYHDRDYLFDIETDYEQETNLEDPETRKRFDDLMSRLLAEHDAPKEQFERLGLDSIDR